MADGHLLFDTKVDESGLNKGTKSIENQFSSTFGKVGTLAKAGLAVVGTAAAGAAAGMVALTKSSLDGVAALEQNVGGAETLFKKSADEVIKNANRAYKTASMSSNDYLSTVTSFSASLLQSLGGDTEKAAKYADRAIIDMSDNANKMGTSMELIQNAYQGFAKQNYTMLDNLKLGYGGTKEEMQRLIDDANRVKKANGEMADLSINSFADVTEAIHIIQSEMGITGTTAKEAATTIEGSMNSAKAAWDNFLAGTATADEFAEAFSTAAEVIGQNLGQIVPRLIETVPIAAQGMYDGLVAAIESQNLSAIGQNILSDLVNGIQTNAPRAIESGMTVLSNFVSGFASEMPALIEGGAQLLSSFIESMGAQAPRLLESGLQIGNSLLSGIVQVGQSLFTVGSDLLGQLASGISTSMPQVLDTASEMVSQLIQTISENAPSVLETGANLLESFLSGVGEKLPELVPQGVALVATLADGVVSNLPTIINAGIDCLAGLVEGIINSLPTLIEEGPRIINDFADAIWGAVGKIITTGANLIVELAKGLLQSLPLIKENAGEILMAIINVMSLSKMLSLGKSLMTNMANGIKGMLSSIKTAGKNVLQNLVNGIKALAKNPVSTLKNIGNNAIKAFKGLSWKGVGKAIIQGIANGIKNGVSTIISAAKTAVRKALDAAKAALGIKSPSRVFRDEVGKMMAQGMGIGFEDNVPTEDMMEKIRESVKHMQKKASEISQTVLVNASNKFNERFVVNGDKDDSNPDPEESILHITNIFEVDGTKLEERTVNATIKKINSKQKDTNAWKGAK